MFLGFSYSFLGFSYIFLGFSYIFLGFSYIFLGFSYIFLGFSYIFMRGSPATRKLHMAVSGNPQPKVSSEIIQPVRPGFRRKLMVFYQYARGYFPTKIL